jgi:hypothetical protein
LKQVQPFLFEILCGGLSFSARQAVHSSIHHLLTNKTGSNPIIAARFKSRPG